MTTVWRLREALGKPGLTVHVIEETGTWNSRSERYFQIHARLDTVAIVVATASGIHAWDVDGKTFDLLRARDRIPELKALMRSAC